MRLIMFVVSLFFISVASAADLADFLRLKIDSQTVLHSEPEYEWSKIEFSQQAVGSWNVYLKKSKQSPGARPAVFIAAGIHTGLETLQLFEQKEDVHLVVFEYAFDKQAKDEQLLVSLLQNSLKMQMQMALTLKWLSAQDFVRADRMNALLVSFSTFISPAALRLAQEWNVRMYSMVFAYGGANIKSFLRDDARLNKDLKNNLEQVLDWLDPVNHLPFLRSQFLVVRGQFDDIIPLSSALALEEKIPSPKKQVVLPTVHIDMARPDIVRQTMQEVLHWYSELGALN